MVIVDLFTEKIEPYHHGMLDALMGQPNSNPAKQWQEWGDADNLEWTAYNRGYNLHYCGLASKILEDK